MQWRESGHDGIAILRLEGEIDLQSSPKFRAILREKHASRCPALVLDFGGVTYLDSSGLATVVEYWRDSRQFAGKLALAGVSERLRTIFEVSRLGEIFSIFATSAEAEAALH